MGPQPSTHRSITQLLPFCLLHGVPTFPCCLHRLGHADALKHHLLLKPQLHLTQRPGKHPEGLHSLSGRNPPPDSLTGLRPRACPGWGGGSGHCPRHTYCRAQVTLPGRKWSDESDVKPGGKEQCLSAWDITLGRGCLGGDRGMGGYGGRDWPTASGREGLSLEMLHAAHVHTWPANSCTKQAVLLRCPHSSERCCRLTPPCLGTKLYQ